MNWKEGLTGPPFLGESGTEQFEVITEVEGKEIGRQSVHDPFIHTRVTIHGWRNAWRVLTSGLKVQVSVSSSQGAQRAIMTLNPHALIEESAVMLRDAKASRESSETVEYNGHG